MIYECRLNRRSKVGNLRFLFRPFPRQTHQLKSFISSRLDKSPVSFISRNFVPRNLINFSRNETKRNEEEREEMEAEKQRTREKRKIDEMGLEKRKGGEKKKIIRRKLVSFEGCSRGRREHPVCQTFPNVSFRLLDGRAIIGRGEGGEVFQYSSHRIYFAYFI